MKSRRKPKAPKHPIDIPLNEQEILLIVTNPFYIGLGPFPQIIRKDQWRQAAIKVIQEVGPEIFIDALLKNLEDGFALLEDMEQ